MSRNGLKHLAKDSVKRLSISAGLELANLLHTLLAGRKTFGNGVIFTLHHVRSKKASPGSPNAHLTITPDFLDAAIRAIIDEGYEIVALSDVPELLRRRSGKRFAVFTMDDGYKDNAREALPVFSRHQAPFTVFATRGLTLRTHTIWWETLEALTLLTDAFQYDFGAGVETLRCGTRAEMASTHQKIALHVIGPQEEMAIAELNKTAMAHGVDPHALVDKLVMNEIELADFSRDPLVSIGAHTVSHRALSFLPDETVRWEMEASADFVQDVTGERPPNLAYPYGFPEAVSERDHRLAAECGFQLAVTTQPGVLSPASLNGLDALPRISLNGLYQKARYARALASGIPFCFMGQFQG